MAKVAVCLQHSPPPPLQSRKEEEKMVTMIRGRIPAKGAHPGRQQLHYYLRQPWYCSAAEVWLRSKKGVAAVALTRGDRRATVPGCG